MRMAVSVRAGVVADLGRVFEIERGCAEAAHWAEADYLAAISATAAIGLARVLLVAESAGQVQGFLVARSGHPAEWEIENIAVAGAVRRVGLGSALLLAFLEQVQRQRPTAEALEVHLEVRESNLAARRLYEKSGFLLDKRRRAYYRDPEEDAILYRLSLQ